MTLLAHLERKIGFIAILHLPIYIVTAQAILYIWCMMNPTDAHLLTLDPLAVRFAGEYWRLLTFAFVIPLQNPLFAVFFLYLIYLYGTALENKWGSFAFTVFYILGIAGTAVAGMIYGGYKGAFYINTSIFLAFAALHPNFELLFFFILPIKVKWIAWFLWLILIRQIWVAPQPEKISILVSIANYLLFFGRIHYEEGLSLARQMIHKSRYRNWNP